MGHAPAPSNSMLPCAWRVVAASSLVMSSPSEDSSSSRPRVAATSQNTPLATAAQVVSAGRGHAQQPPTASAAASTVGRSESPGSGPVGDATTPAGNGNMILSLRDSGICETQITIYHPGFATISSGFAGQFWLD